RLEFMRRSGVTPDTGIDAVLVPLEEFVKDLPPYWVRLVNGTPIRETITDPDTGETVPRASEAQNLTPVSIKRLSPEYPTDLNDYSISGSVVLRVIVDEKGKTKVVNIDNFGLSFFIDDHTKNDGPGNGIVVEVCGIFGTEPLY